MVEREIERLLARARLIPWLTPRAELADKSRAEPFVQRQVERLRASLRIHAGLVALDGAPSPSIGASMSDACDLFERSFRRADSSFGPYSDFHGDEGVLALSDLRDRILSRAAAVLGPTETARLEANVESAASASLRASAPWQRAFGSAWQGPLPGVSTVLAQAAWLVAGGSPTASPFDPLLAILDRGGWPVPLPDANVHVYAAHVVHGRVEPEPEKPGSSVPHERREHERVREYYEIESPLDRIALFLETVGTWPWPPPAILPDLAPIGFPPLPWIYEETWVAYPP